MNKINLGENFSKYQTIKTANSKMSFKIHNTSLNL